MPSHRLDFPIFDADNHMYETPDAFTRHLPEVRGRDPVRAGERPHQDRGQGPDQRLHPEPDVRDVVAAPGAQEEYFKSGNPEGRAAGDPRQADPGAARPSSRPPRGSR